jgi:hypothetical protein
MVRFALVGLAALGLMAGAVAAQGKMDCGATYKGFMDKFQQEKAAGMAGDQLANVNRLALRAYDACRPATSSMPESCSMTWRSPQVATTGHEQSEGVRASRPGNPHARPLRPS